MKRISVLILCIIYFSCDTATEKEKNAAPTFLKTIANTTLKTGETYSKLITATDPNNDELTYTISSLPSWLTFTNNTLSGTPGNNDLGKSDITVEVSDGKLTATQTFSITVTEDLPAVIEVNENQNILNIGSDYLCEITVSDPEGNDVEFTVKDLPIFLNYNADTKVISGSPRSNHIGTYEIKLSANDGYSTKEEILTIEVYNAFEWRQGGTNQDEIKLVTTASDGGFIIAMQTFEASDNNTSTYYLSKLDKNGELEWSRYYGENSKNKTPKDIIEMPDGIIYVTGVRTLSSGSKTAWLEKYNPDGFKFASFNSEHIANSNATSVGNLDGTDVIIAGYVNTMDVGTVSSESDNMNTNYDVWISSVSSSGSTLWSKTIDYNGIDKVNAMVKVSDGFLLGGFTSDLDNSNHKSVIIKIDFQGNEVWKKEYDSGIVINDIKSLNNDDFVIAGYATGTNSNNTHNYIALMNKEGVQQWEKFEEKSDSQQLTSLLLNNNSIIASGFHYPTSNSKSQAYILQYDFSGNLITEKIIGSENKHEKINYSSVTSDGGYIFVGFISKENTDDNDSWALKLDADFNIFK